MNNKLGFSAGILNVILGALLIIDAVLLAVFAFCFLLLSFSLFFMAAIPAFLVTGFLCIVTFGGAIANTVTGGGAILTSVRGGKISKIFSTVSVIVDVAVIPANIVALSYGAYIIFDEITVEGAVSVFPVIITIITAVAIIIAVASLIFNIVCLTRTKKAVISEPSAIDV